MKIVKNLESHSIHLPFNFNTYTFPISKIVSVPDDVYDFLKSNFPLSFSFDVDTKKPVSEVKSEKTKAYIKPEEHVATFKTGDMNIETGRPNNTFAGIDDTPADGIVDRDGVGWYGEGIEIEGANNG